MNRSPNKDLYLILGVKPDSTQKEIREAYLSRTRIIHPDRIDRQRNPKDWEKANEMLAELNEAYSVLRDSSARVRYDDSRRERRQSESPPPPRTRPAPEPSPLFAHGEFTSGQAAFGDLPKHVQTRLLKRQQNKKGEEQFQVKLSSFVWNYVLIALLLCWFWYLFTFTSDTKWKDDTLLWHAGITLVVAGFIGRNLITILKNTKARLKPFFYVTPIYFIKTENDIVSFRPIWMLKDVAITHNHTNGSYRNSDVVLKFDGYNEFLRFSAKWSVETFLTTLRNYDIRLKTAFANRDFEYFLKNDDFRHVPRTSASMTVLLSTGMQAFIYFAVICVCEFGLLTATIMNEKLLERQWARPPTPPVDIKTSPPLYVTSPPTPSRVAVPLYPKQELPDSGAVQMLTDSKPVAPFEIKAAQGSHYLLKLADTKSNVPVMTVFVRSGSIVKVKVPLGTYDVRYASGETWYGYEHFFGPETSYSKANQTFTFEVVGNQVSGYTLTLYKVAHGNLRMSDIKPTDF